MPNFSTVDMGKTLEYKIRKESFSQAVIRKISHCKDFKIYCYCGVFDRVTFHELTTGFESVLKSEFKTFYRLQMVHKSRHLF